MIVKHDSMRLAMIVLAFCVALVASQALAASAAGTPWETPNGNWCQVSSFWSGWILLMGVVISGFTLIFDGETSRRIRYATIVACGLALANMITCLFL
ncbi:TrbC/VirB2 family protein [Nitrosospira sp. Is2]|uniref:TrbC/VirB2 family protein n=1 Tax=Nitrosospira sp. Is2 TaxID=3080532 RepID=UPI0029549614|nr:TrbC/VirB2 family protein [Nitrosospira sp. Is2]WON74205.1 TrbC/VirB2 family protein [Nitrosospira sp. Is2]